MKVSEFLKKFEESTYKDKFDELDIVFYIPDKNDARKGIHKEIEIYVKAFLNKPYVVCIAGKDE